MQGCCSAVSRLQAVLAVVAERLPSLARNRTFRPKGVVGRSSTCAVLSKSGSASCASVAAARASIGLLNAPTWIAHAPLSVVTEVNCVADAGTPDGTTDATGWY